MDKYSNIENWSRAKLQEESDKLNPIADKINTQLYKMKHDAVLAEYPIYLDLNTNTSGTFNFQ